MTTWTSQMGFPLIHVDSRIEPGKKILTLTQEKFNADGRYEKIVSYMQCTSFVFNHEKCSWWPRNYFWLAKHFPKF